MSKILFLSRENKIHIFKPPCNVPFIIDMLMTAFLMIFRRFPKIFQNCSEGQTSAPKHFPKISEDVRRLPKTFEEDPKMFR